MANLLPLSKTHHAAFDRALFTIDREYRLRANPSFETDSDLLQRTILNREGNRPQSRLRVCTHSTSHSTMRRLSGCELAFTT
ncbi:HNH endonuclease [Haloarcula brevis]|uniref:HNH endonuclease n=1 Tax=Haloarcula brevis TaxID=3111453 RepID=UPI00387ECE46